MKEIKITVMMLLISQAIVAQTKTPAQKVERKVERMEEVIVLTPQQKSNIINIMQANEVLVSDMRSKEVVDKNAIQDLKKEELSQIKEVLTPEQQTALKASQGAKKEEHKLKKEKRAEREAAKSALLEKRAAFDVKLTTSEKVEIEKARVLLPAKVTGKDARAAITDEQKAQNKSARKEINEILKPIVKNHKADLDTIKGTMPINSDKKKDGKKNKHSFYNKFLLMK